MAEENKESVVEETKVAIIEQKQYPPNDNNKFVLSNTIDAYYIQ